MEANATTLSIAKDLGLSGFFQEDILINLRTFDSRSLIFYAYDYHNNFVQLHIEDDSQVVFTYNSGNTIRSVATTVKSNTIPVGSYRFVIFISMIHSDLASGQSVQVLIDREPESTTLRVSTRFSSAQNTVQAPLRLIDRYARGPWSNKEKGKPIKLA